MARLLLTMPTRTRADLRGDGGGVSQACHERDDLRAPLRLGVVQRRAANLPTGKRREGRRWRRPPRRERAGAVGGAEGRRGAYAGPLPPKPHPRPSLQSPLTPPSSALCAIAHLVLEARVGPRLEQRLDAGSVAVGGREVQRRPLVLPRRGGGRTHAGERRRRAGRWCLKAEGEGAQGAGWGRLAGRRSPCLWRQAWHPWR